MSEMIRIFADLEHSSDKWVHYFEVYEKHLSNRRWNGGMPNLVEIGVQNGGSLEFWSRYFGPQSRITGIDIDLNCNNLQYKQENIDIWIGSQLDPKFWDRFLEKNPRIDVLIDDGGHDMDQQIYTFERVFPTMPIGSVYICEDTHTSYMIANGGGLEYQGSFIEYAKGLADVLHQNWTDRISTKYEHKKNIAQGLSSVHFYDSMVVFEKLGLPKLTRVVPNRFVPAKVEK